MKKEEVYEKTDKVKENVAKATGIFLFGTQLYNTGKALYNWYDRRTTYSVTVKSDNDVYSDIQDWILANVPAVEQKSLVVAGSSRVRGQLGGDDEEPKPVVLHSDETIDRKVSIDGHDVVIRFVRGEQPRNGMGIIHIEPDCIVFDVKSLDARDAVVEKIATMRKIRRLSEKVAYVLQPNSYDEWSNKGLVQRRPEESIILPQGQMERVFDDLEQFMDSENKYIERAIPYHRGYLFHGPPGTGKSSLAAAIAYKYKMDLYYLNLSELQKDSKLSDLLNYIKPKSILLLEDIDVFKATHEREESKGVTLAGLLNALDGVLTPHGLITIMTTNHKDVLDDAVIRAGRIDRTEHLDYANADQVSRAFKFFYGEELGQHVQPYNTSISEIMEVFKRNMDDAEAGRKALINR